jgi:hypothetical protein
MPGTLVFPVVQLVQKTEPVYTAYLQVSQLVQTVNPAFNTYFQALQERQALSRSFFVLTRAAKGAFWAGRWIRAMRQRSPIRHAQWLLRRAVARGLPFAVDAAASHLLEGDAAGFVAERRQQARISVAALVFALGVGRAAVQRLGRAHQRGSHKDCESTHCT